MTRPPELRLTVGACLATVHGQRRGSGVTIGLRRSLVVAVAMAASVVHGSTIAIESAIT